MNNRDTFFSTLDDLHSLKGLEIGPLTSPVIKRKDIKKGGQIFYLDHLATNELKEKYREDNSVKTVDIQEVDFVCRNGDMVGAVAQNRFDYVVASHVIEHVPNVLKFLCDVYDLLVPGGIVFLVIPDKRFTFDVKRPQTSFGSLLESFYLNKNKPGVGAVYDHFSQAMRVSSHDVWYGSFRSEEATPLLSSSKAWALAESVHKNDEYLDVHVNVFTPQSFLEILKKAIEHDIVTFKVEKFCDTQSGHLEFMIALKKPASDLDELTKNSCLKTIPELHLENILSPYMPQVKSLSKALESSTKTAQSLEKELTQSRRTVSEYETKIHELKTKLHFKQSVLDRRIVKCSLLLANAFHQFLGFLYKRRYKK